MKILARILFWLTVFGTGLAMVAPLLFGGASYREAQPVVILGLVLTLVFAALAIPKSTAPGVDPYAQAVLRRRAGASYAFIALLVIGITTVIEFVRAYTDLDRMRSSTHKIEMWALDDVAAGSWTGVIGFCACGVAFLLMIGILLRKPEQTMAAPPRMYPQYGPYLPS